MVEPLGSEPDDQKYIISGMLNIVSWEFAHSRFVLKEYYDLNFLGITCFFFHWMQQQLFVAIMFSPGSVTVIILSISSFIALPSLIY